MQFTGIAHKIQKYLKSLLENQEQIQEAVTAISEAGGVAYIVGGAVRDLLLNIPIKDIDIEVHGLELNKLESILQRFGHINLVGKSFGVIRIYDIDIDWSIPRRDSAGRHPQVIFDPTLTIKEAFERRDLTINAMGIQILTGELVDPFNGRVDLQAGILRTPNPTLFVEDPLRFYRVMQFISRFEMHPDTELHELCKTMDISNVARERIASEFEKMILRSHKPSLGIRWLKKINRLKENLPQLDATKDIPQDPEWHPEGDVFEHLMQSFDAAALLAYECDRDKLIVCFAALLHDIGKSSTTNYIDGRWHSYNHESVSAQEAKKALSRVTTNHELIQTICTLIAHHMAPTQFIAQKAKPTAYKRLAHALAPQANLELLAQLALADAQGKNPERGTPLTTPIAEIELFLEYAHAAEVISHPEPPLLSGKDLLDIVKPGPELGALVKRAYEIQLAEGITDKEALKKRIIDLISQ